jgi:phytoene dehydrogenase-like protein
MGSITQAMAREARARGVELSVDAPVAEVRVRQGRATGVVLRDGTEIDAACVVSNVHPKRLLRDLLPADALDEDVRERVAGHRNGSGTVRMNVALRALPRFTCQPAEGAHHRSGIILAPSLGYMERAWMDARREGLAREPIVEMLIPSTVDDSLAPPGLHVASLFCQQFAPELPDGRSWADHREEVADHIIDTVEAYAPNFRKSILGRMVLTPMDLEQRFGLIGGDIMHGAMTLDQMWAARPQLGHGDYRGPIKGLYMCGAGSHPGGGVTGLPGRNAAREVLRDFRRAW